MNHPLPEFTLWQAVLAVLIALGFISLMSLLREPQRRTLNALLIAGAGSVYWSGGLGVWEFAFGSLMLWVAYRGLNSYFWIGIGWLLHTGWDLLHHFYGSPIVSMAPSSSAGCAVCDPLLALWFFAGAPSLFKSFRSIPQA